MFFDTHSHLNSDTFDANLSEVVDRAVEAGVTRINIVGTCLQDSRRAVEIAQTHDSLFATVGIQPNYVDEAGADDLDAIRELAADPKVIAIGETGLDRYWDRAPFELQQKYFDDHIRMSLELDLPFVVHMRECGQDILHSLEPFRGQPLRGIMHSFTGDSDLAAACMDFGLDISFAGMVTYKKSDELRATAASIPMDKLLIETDCPYLSPHPHRGKRPNEPAWVVHTAECLSEVKKCSLNEIAEQTTRNACRLFKLNHTTS